MEELAIRFDAMASHDITYVGIIQTARASGMQAFPLARVLYQLPQLPAPWGARSTRTTMCSACRRRKKYGGESVPAHQSVIHSYMRER